VISEGSSRASPGMIVILVKAPGFPTSLSLRGHKMPPTGPSTSAVKVQHVALYPSRRPGPRLSPRWTCTCDGLFDIDGTVSDSRCYGARNPMSCLGLGEILIADKADSSKHHTGYCGYQRSSHMLALLERGMICQGEFDARCGSSLPDRSLC
jgi:hypothetical protein